MFGKDFQCTILVVHVVGCSIWYMPRCCRSVTRKCTSVEHAKIEGWGWKCQHLCRYGVCTYAYIRTVFFKGHVFTHMYKWEVFIIIHLEMVLRGLAILYLVADWFDWAYQMCGSLPDFTVNHSCLVGRMIMSHQEHVFRKLYLKWLNFHKIN